MTIMEQQILKLLDQNTNLISKVAELNQVPVQIERLSRDMAEIKSGMSDIRQSIAVHSNRLSSQEKDSEKLRDLLERRRVETDTETKGIYKKIDEVEDDLREDFKKSNEAILTKIDTLIADQKTHSENINKRIGRMEKWLWTILGGGAIIGWVIEHFFSTLLTVGIAK